MQESRILRARRPLGMSQPVVSNAVAQRLKVMFNDELCSIWTRNSATARAFQLFGSVRQGVTIGANELPDVGLEPTSERVFNLCVQSADNILTSQIYNRRKNCAKYLLSF